VNKPSAAQHTFAFSKLPSSLFLVMNHGVLVLTHQQFLCENIMSHWQVGLMRHNDNFDLNDLMRETFMAVAMVSARGDDGVRHDDDQ